VGLKNKQAVFWGSISMRGLLTLGVVILILFLFSSLGEDEVPGATPEAAGVDVPSSETPAVPAPSATVSAPSPTAVEPSPTALTPTPTTIEMASPASISLDALRAENAIRATLNAVPTSTRQIASAALAMASPQPTVGAVPEAVAQAPALAGRQQANVIRVIDGDTIQVEMADQWYSVRYIGIDTPEVGDICADEATAANALLVLGKTVTLVKDISETDRYRRLLRYVYLGDMLVNAELVRQGYAQPVTYPPDVANADLFVDLASQAREAGVGCYSTVQNAAPPSKQTFYVTGAQGVNIRSCASTSCAVLTAAAYGAAIEVVATANEWHEIRLPDGRTGYIAAWLTSSSQPQVAPARPVVQQPAAPRPPAPVGPTIPDQPAQQEPPAPPPPVAQEPPPPPPAAPAFVCDCSKTCPIMVSCEEAYFQLNQCGCGRRDGDSDGVPCEEICPGG